jgi:hypothetical protein
MNNFQKVKEGLGVEFIVLSEQLFSSFHAYGSKQTRVFV